MMRLEQAVQTRRLNWSTQGKTLRLFHRIRRHHIPGACRSASCAEAFQPP